MNQRLEIFIPFEGFYESSYSDGIDREFECEAENVHDLGCKHSLDKINEIMFKHTDYRKCYLAMARLYVDSFNEYVYQASDNDETLRLSFKELISPREYNFTTDRILCEIDAETVLHLFATTTPLTLAEMCKERHTSYSGFHSFYSNDWMSWPKNVTEWDCNQLETLLMAWMLDNCDDCGEWRSRVLEICCEASDFSSAFDAGYDWNAARAELGITE